jgi:hypothetical protein
MRTFRFAMVGLLAVAAGLVGWRFAGPRLHRRISSPVAQASVGQTVNPQSQIPSPQAPAQNTLAQVLTTAPATESVKRLGPFSIMGRDYTVELQTKKLQPGSADSADSLVAMEIRDAAGAVQYRRTFPDVEVTEEFEDWWSVSAWLLTGTNGTGLLVAYDGFSEPSAPEEEPTRWFQIFGVRDGKLVPFGAPLELQGDLLDEYTSGPPDLRGVLRDEYPSGHTYKAARPLGAQADIVEFKVWTGHCRLIFPVHVDWAQGKLSPAQECVKTGGELGRGCQYKVLPEDRRKDGITFVRLWPSPDEKSGQPTKTVVKEDSKVELLTALVATHWLEGPPNSAGPWIFRLDDAGSFGVTPGGVADTHANSDLWLKVRIDGKEGWMHSEEDFYALGLPEDE